MRLIALLLAAAFFASFAVASRAAGFPSGPAAQNSEQFLKATNEKRRKRENKQLSAEQIYKKAQKSLHDENYRDALKKYDTLQSKYPFSTYAIQAQLDTVYANYQLNKPETALAAAHRFLREHPRNPNADYVYYLQGMINFKRVTHQSNRFFHVDGARRDNRYVTQAYQDFSSLIQRFPGSRYNADARQRMIYLKNEMARRQWYIAKYYMRREAWLAANRRAQGIVKNYQDTKWARKALKIMEESYNKLNLKQAAANARKIRQANSPGKEEKRAKEAS